MEIIDTSLVNHVVKHRNGTVLVGDDRESAAGGHGGTSDLVDVLDPAGVGFEAVGGEADELDVALGELGGELGEGPEFSSALLG